MINHRHGVKNTLVTHRNSSTKYTSLPNLQEPSDEIIVQEMNDKDYLKELLNRTGMQTGKTRMGHINFVTIELLTV